MIPCSYAARARLWRGDEARSSVEGSRKKLRPRRVQCNSTSLLAMLLAPSSSGTSAGARRRPRFLVRVPALSGDSRAALAAVTVHARRCRADDRAAAARRGQQWQAGSRFGLVRVPPRDGIGAARLRGRAAAGVLACVPPLVGVSARLGFLGGGALGLGRMTMTTTRSGVGRSGSILLLAGSGAALAEARW